MDKILKDSLLFDFYGELLTGKQKEIYKLYTEEDFSLSEIADKIDVTRQSVYDTIKNTKKILEDYELKLGLVSKFIDQRKQLEQILEIIDESNHEKISIVKQKIVKMMRD